MDVSKEKNSSILDCSNSLQNQVLMETDSTLNSSVPENQSGNLRVYTRIRPLLPEEIDAGHKECINTVDDQTVQALVPVHSLKCKSHGHLGESITEEYTFTSSFGPEVDELKFFRETMLNALENFIDRQNSLVFNYGTSGSGKTYTFQGNEERPGIIPLALYLLFASVEHQLLKDVLVQPSKYSDLYLLSDIERKEVLELKDQLLSYHDEEDQNDIHFSKAKAFETLLCVTFFDKYKFAEEEINVSSEDKFNVQDLMQMQDHIKTTAEKQSGLSSIWISYVEIFNENIYDLLQQTPGDKVELTLDEDSNGDTYIKGATEICVSNSYEAVKLLNFGRRNLKVPSTELTDCNNSGFSIFTIKMIRIPSIEAANEGQIYRFSFCDFTGFEQASNGSSVGFRGGEICDNTSLQALKRCFQELRMNRISKCGELLPFYESKLTCLFSGYFTGKGNVVMIANISPSACAIDDTLNVLRFSAVTKQLIVDDAYIATASDTLQCISDQWAIAKSGSSNLSSLSVAINFDDDSLVDVIQEKDELIEKLLDLAESLRNNLEKEKKEKAELILQTRHDICCEHSEYTEKLMENQKMLYEEELETIKKIYKKRLSAEEELSENAGTCENNFEEDTLTSNSKFIEHMEQDVKDVYEIENIKNRSSSNVGTSLDGLIFQLEETTEARDQLKREIDHFEAENECYKQDIAELQEERNSLLENIASLSKQLESAKEENSTLDNKLNNAEKFICSLKEMVNQLKKESENLEKWKDECEKDYKLAVVNIKMNAEEAKNNLDAGNAEVENTLKSIEKQIHEIDTLANECMALKSEFAEMRDSKKALEGNYDSVVKELALANAEHYVLINKLKESGDCISTLNETVDHLKNEIEELHKEKYEYQRNFEESLKECRVEVESSNFDLRKALETLEEQQQKLHFFETECNAHKSGLSETKSIMEEKLMLLTEELATANMQNAEIDSKREEAEKSVSTLNETINHLKEEIENLQNQKAACLKELDDALGHIEKNAKIELEDLNIDLEKATQTIEEQKKLFSNLQSDYNIQKEALSQLSDIKKALEEKLGIVNEELSTSRAENHALNGKLDASESAVSNLIQIILGLKKELEELTEKKHESDKKFEDLKELEKKLEVECHDVNKELQKALETIDTQNKKHSLLQFECTSQSTELSELHETKKSLQEKLNVIAEQLIAANAENAQLSEKKHDIENSICTLNNTVADLKHEIEALNKEKWEFKKTCEELGKKATESKDELDSANLKLKESLEVIEEQKQELNILKAKCLSYKDELNKLQKDKDSLDEKLNADSLEFDVIQKLVIVLQKCEVKATKKIEKLYSDCLKFAEEIKTLKQSVQDNEDKITDSQKGYDLMCALVNILERCEMKASTKTKELHSASVLHVDQIMDLGSQVREKENSIEAIKKELSDVKKQLKELQSSSKKQLEAERKQHINKIENMKALKGLFENENLKLKESIHKMEEENASLKLDISKTKNTLLESRTDEVKEKKESNFTKPKTALRENQIKMKPKDAVLVCEEDSKTVKRKISKKNLQNDCEMPVKKVKRKRVEDQNEENMPNIVIPSFRKLTESANHVPSPRMTRNRKKLVECGASHGKENIKSKNGSKQRVR